VALLGIDVGGTFTEAVLLADGTITTAKAPAAAAGNVETSGRIVEVVFAALAGAVYVPAQGQGTINNVACGYRRFSYHETVGGRQGAAKATFALAAGDLITVETPRGGGHGAPPGEGRNRG
jgi:N-methylhydantoinase B/oxoprolinase/acetone carboxylase alpha subunit